MGETFAIVDIRIPGEAAKHGLAEPTGQQVASVLARTALQQRCTGQVGQAERIAGFPVGQRQSGVIWEMRVQTTLRARSAAISSAS